MYNIRRVKLTKQSTLRLVVISSFALPFDFPSSVSDVSASHIRLQNFLSVFLPYFLPYFCVVFNQQRSCRILVAHSSEDGISQISSPCLVSAGGIQVSRIVVHIAFDFE